MCLVVEWVESEVLGLPPAASGGSRSRQPEFSITTCWCRAGTNSRRLHS